LKGETTDAYRKNGERQKKRKSLISDSKKNIQMQNILRLIEYPQWQTLCEDV